VRWTEFFIRSVRNYRSELAVVLAMISSVRSVRCLDQRPTQDLHNTGLSQIVRSSPAGRLLTRSLLHPLHRLLPSHHPHSSHQVLPIHSKQRSRASKGWGRKLQFFDTQLQISTGAQNFILPLNSPKWGILAPHFHLGQNFSGYENFFSDALKFRGTIAATPLTPRGSLLSRRLTSVSFNHFCCGTETDIALKFIPLLYVKQKHC